MSEKSDNRSQSSAGGNDRQVLTEGYSLVQKGYTPAEKPGATTAGKLPAGPTGGTGASGPPAAPKQEAGNNTSEAGDAKP